MIELKIKKKYFNAILELKKPFELRHEPIPKGSIVKLICIEEPTKEQQEKLEQLNKNSSFGWKLKEHYIIFESGECKELIKSKEFNSGYFCRTSDWCYTFDTCFNRPTWSWYDNFCWDYINKKQTYVIEIAKIMEVR